MNLMLVDDHPIVLEALSTILKSRFPEAKIICVQDLKNFDKKIQSVKAWDCVVIDLNFNGEFRGFDLIGTVKSLPSPPPVIVLSMHTEPAIIKKALDHGANAYVTKTEAPSEIFTAFTEIRSGRNYVSKFSKTALKDLTEAETVELSRREQEIASLVMAGDTSKDIGKKLAISTRTVESHRINIMRKLGAKNTAQLIGILRQRV